MIRRLWLGQGMTLLTLVCTAYPLWGAEAVNPILEKQQRKGELGQEIAKLQQPQWHYGGFVDLGYSLNFSFPENHLFRGRSTTPRVNELDLNMVGAYIRKDVSEQSRWGMELLAHSGQDAKEYGFETGLSRVGSSDQLRHFGRANVSYLAPIGNGLTVQAGLFPSLVGYESLYAKDNFSYTRTWIADHSPYLMFGANASYPLTDSVTATVFIINSYFHLSHANNLPTYGAHVAYTPTPRWTVKQAFLYGPEQANTALEFWRLFSDTIIQWKDRAVTVAFEQQIGTETLAITGSPRAFWIGYALPAHWRIQGPWSVTLRPELFYDPNGVISKSEQFVKAVTTTLEYKVPYAWTNTILRLEYRFDESTGSGGGFFKNGQIAPGVIGLTAAQHLLIFAAIWTFDSP